MDINALEANALIQCKNYKEALYSVNKALLLKPLQNDLLFLKANILESLKSYNEALRILISLKQSEKSPTINETYTRIKKLLKENAASKEPYAAWMKSLGSKFNKITLKCFAPDYRGIIATKPISANEVIISIPRNGIITVKMAKETNIGKKIIESNTSLIYPNNSLLSVYVLLEKANPKTKWKHFIESLPKSMSNFPLFFIKKERALLTGSPFLGTFINQQIAKVDQLRDDIKKDYKAICNVAPEFEEIANLEDFMRTRVLVNSRIFGLRIDNEPNDSIVPYADMFNYKYKSKMTHWAFNEESNSFIVKAQEFIQEGSEIFVYYGNKPNHSFFQFYGFVVENNENDEVCIKTSGIPTDRLLEFKESMLVRKYLKFRVSKDTGDIKFSQLMSYLRYLTFEGTLEELLEVH